MWDLGKDGSEAAGEELLIRRNTFSFFILCLVFLILKIQQLLF